ncbi:MAG TPA: hemolysin family protein [Fimbriimonadaceae bacterium]|nr:hemolysin family protein [Fimbriimonadaceae bacterium]
MKTRKRSMKDRAHQRGTRKGDSIRRFEGNLALTLALSFLAVWAIGGRLQEGFEFAAALPATDGPSPSIGISLVIFLLVVVSTLLTAAETAIEALRPAHVRLVKERNAARAEKLQFLLDGKARFVAACTIANQFFWFAVVLCTFLLAPGLLDMLRDRFGWANNHANLLGAAVILLAPVALIHLIIGEILPKSYASVHPIRVSVGLYRLAIVTALFFAIPAKAVTALRSFITARFGSQPTEENANLAEEEIKTLAESAHETGEIEVGERELLHSVFEFADTVAREVMTPRVDIDAMPVRSDPTEVVRVIQESGHSRIPLYEDTDDQIVGIIHAKDLFSAMLNGKAPNLRTLMRPPLFVPENKSLHELLAEMRASRSQMAVVQDEFGGTAGILTIEDIVEELVGDIVDEYDVEEPEVVPAAGGWLVDAKTHIDDLNEAIQGDLVSDEFDTVGGYVFGLFGRQPKLGESVEADGWRFIISETDGRRILRLRVEPAPETAAIGSSDSLE